MDSASIDIPTPDDWHVHLRDDEMLAVVAPMTAQVFRYALVMPNLVEPIDTTEAAIAYRQRILEAVNGVSGSVFEPLMSLYLTERLSVDDLRKGLDGGDVFAVKYYPSGATTNSASGRNSILDASDTLEAMSAYDVPLLVHAESTDEHLDIYDRERAFLDNELQAVVKRFPDLRVTIEHLSTKNAVDFVSEFPQVKGSITPHHLSCDRSDVLANGLRPDLYCKPVINSASDRLALVRAATSGSPDYFLGTDSAPHPQSHKHAAIARPGIFSAPFALQVVAEVFYRAGSLDTLPAFACLNGCSHYGLLPAESTTRLTRTDGTDAVAVQVAEALRADVRIFGEAEAALWQVEPLV